MEKSRVIPLKTLQEQEVFRRAVENKTTNPSELTSRGHSRKSVQNVLNHIMNTARPPMTEDELKDVIRNLHRSQSK